MFLGYFDALILKIIFYKKYYFDIFMAKHLLLYPKTILCIKSNCYHGYGFSYLGCDKTMA